jgi:hypothetical protein
MITDIPIDGATLTGRVDSNGWREWIFGLTGHYPNPSPEGVKDTRPTSVSYKCLRDIGPCPKGAHPQTVQRYACTYMWYVLSRVLFTDGSRDTASWMWIDPLRDWNTKYSWGSVALAYLYRQVELININTYLLFLFDHEMLQFDMSF